MSCRSASPAPQNLSLQVFLPDPDFQARKNCTGFPGTGNKNYGTRPGLRPFWDGARAFVLSEWSTFAARRLPPLVDFELLQEPVERLAGDSGSAGGPGDVPAVLLVEPGQVMPGEAVPRLAQGQLLEIEEEALGRRPAFP